MVPPSPGDAESAASAASATSAEAMDGTLVAAPNTRLIAAALDAIFEEQQAKDGLWVAGQPIFLKSSSSVSPSLGVDPGNSFTFAPDMLGSLLKILPPDAFRPHLAGLERTLAWVESHQISDVVPQFCD
mgnify:CR=1 FL=1